MAFDLMLTGDVNLMNVADPAVPFRKVADTLKSAAFVFSNLECCLYQPSHGVNVDKDRTNEGFFADPLAGEALLHGGIQAVGIANNVNYGAEAILASVARLDELGVPHTGAGADVAAAKAPVIVERQGVRIGVLQRTAVYWANNHEATAYTPGVAAIKCHTAYQIPTHRLRADMQTPNRPGLPPLILTWMDPKYRQAFRDEIAALRPKCDVLIVSCHWGLKLEVMDYMTEMAHEAIDAGADVVMGHGPHYSLPLELYRGKPVFYGLGSFSFHTGHAGRKHGDWVGMLARIRVDGKAMQGASFRLVRHNDANETVVCNLDREEETIAFLGTESAKYGVMLERSGAELLVMPA